MSRLIVFRREDTNEHGSSVFEHTQVLRDPSAVIERIQRSPGTIACVAIPPDFADASGVVQLIRDADPTVSVAVLGSLASSEDLAEILQRATSRQTGSVATPRGKPAVLATTPDSPSIDALTAGIAHDVGTPMTAILGYAQLIAKSVGDEKNRTRATRIVEQVHRVSELIETLLNRSHKHDRGRR